MGDGARKVNYDVVCDMASLGLTLEAIAREVGCSREMVRQILKKYGINIKDFKPAKPTRPIPFFKARMYKWLESCGYLRCFHCGWQEESKFPPKWKRICRSCNTKRCRKAYNENPSVWLYGYYYRRSDRGREVQKKASRKWREKQKLQGLKKEEEGHVA